jgi:hypothetical protein
MDPRQVGIAAGAPGPPETNGVFLTAPDIDDARFFARMGSGRRIDVWRVEVTGLSLEEQEGGWWVCREVIPPDRLDLVEVWDSPRGGGDELRPVPLPRLR